MFIGSGQSNIHILGEDAVSSGSGDGTPGTNALSRVMAPAVLSALETHYGPSIQPKLRVECGDTSFGGSPVLYNAGAHNSWWLEDTDEPGAYLLAWEARINSIPDLANYRAIILAWAQGEYEVGQLEADYPLALWASSTPKVWTYMRGVIAARGFTGPVPVYIQQLGTRPTGIDQDRLNLARTMQNALVDEANKIYLGPSTLDITRVADDDWHPVNDYSPGNDPVVGCDKMAENLAAVVAPAFVALSA